MGCDIHMFVEIRNPSTGAWEFVPAEGNAPQDDWDRKNNRWSWFGGRNYTLFGILADVRGSSWPPISEPRGIPEDASLEYLSVAYPWKLDGHSHSWLTVAEIDAYNWGQTRLHKEVVSAPLYALRRAGKEWLHMWIALPNMSRQQEISHEQMEQYLGSCHFQDLLSEMKEQGKMEEHLDLLAATHEEMRAKHGSVDSEFEPTVFYTTEVSALMTPIDDTQWFRKNLLPLLREMGPPEDVRIVFFFDN